MTQRSVHRLAVICSAGSIGAVLTGHIRPAVILLAIAVGLLAWSAEVFRTLLFPGAHARPSKDPR